MNIPTMKELYAQIAEYIKNNQVEKGYIDVQNDNCDCDTIYCYACMEDYYDMHKIDECKVYGIRVSESGRIEICYESIFDYSKLYYTESDFENAEWYDIEYGEFLYFDTLISIAESIEEY